MNDNDLIFCVIMPCYNSEEYVRGAIESLLNQTYSSWKLIAVNDGSTDDTLAILNEYASKDNRISVYTKKNGGYATAINYGLDRISGDYFLMLGSDDRFASNLFQKIVDGLDEKEPDMIAFRSIRFQGNENIGLDCFTEFDSASCLFNTNINEYYNSFPQQSRILFVRDTAKCYKTELLGDLRYFGKYGIDADGIFSLLFTYKCQSFMSLPIDGYYWTIRNDSVSASASLEKNIDRVHNWNKYLSALLKENKASLIEREKECITLPFRLACRLLKNKKQLSFSNILSIHFSLRKSIVLSKKYRVGLMEFNEIFETNQIKSCIFQLFPISFLIRHGFV